MNEAQIREILDKLTTKLKAASSSTKKDEEVYKRAEWGMLYKKATAHAEEIEVHACGDFPKKLLADTFPNETKEERDYRHKTFQPVTEPYWKKGLRTLNRIWSEQNYSLKWNDEAAEQYFTKDYPLFQNVINYFKSVVTASKINDPNSLLVMDFELPVREVAEGEIEIDQSKEIQPYATIYESEDVLMCEDNDFALVMSEERSSIQFGNTAQMIGYVLYLYDEESIYRIEQYGKKVDWTFRASVYYTHNLGYLPCWKLQGTPEAVINDEVLYDSHFSPAIPYLNEAVIIHSTLKASINKLAYPTRVYYEQPCTAGCSNGKIYGEGGVTSNCSSCGGTGQLKFSPFRDYVHELPTATKPSGQQDVAFPGLQYVSPDSAILDFSKQTIDDWISKAFLFLNIEAVPDGMKAGMGEDATATKSKIDREEQFVSMLDISNELYSVLEKFLNAAYMIRYSKESPMAINPPKTFELTSASELTDELGKAKSKNMPDIAISELTKDYVSKRFSQKDEVGQITKVICFCDPLFTKTANDVSVLKGAGSISKTDAVLHVYIYSFIETKLLENAKYLETDLLAIKNELFAMATEKVAELDKEQQSAEKIIANMAT